MSAWRTRSWDPSSNSQPGHGTQVNGSPHKRAVLTNRTDLASQLGSLKEGGDPQFASSSIFHLCRQRWGTKYSELLGTHESLPGKRSVCLKDRFLYPASPPPLALKVFTVPKNFVQIEKASHQWNIRNLNIKDKPNTDPCSYLSRTATQTHPV